ncbi:MAG TPA: prolyl oligopeptidase family serine peptidase [Candidatus Polarisedimenticolia bacterium]|nr:prolyl oligopeptidase family serine peptidase [Candidatus Polarisedimenticolia bacterium]
MTLPRRVWPALLLSAACLAASAAAASREAGRPAESPFQWLEEAGPRTEAWLREQKARTDAHLALLTSREAVRRRLEALWSHDRSSVPWRAGGRLFFSRQAGGEPQPSLYSLEDPAGRPARVLDAAAVSPDGATAVHEFAVSPDGRLIAYLVSPGGGDLNTVRVREIAAGRDLPGVSEGALTAVCWLRDASGYLFVRREPGGTGKQLVHHRLGSGAAQDRVLRAWGEKARWVYGMTSEDGRYLLVVAEQGTSSEIVVSDLGKASAPDLSAPFLTLLPGAGSFHTPIDVVGSTLYLRTDFGAPRGRVLAVDLARGSGAQPREIVAESSATIADAVITADRIVLHELVDVRSRLRTFSLQGKPLGEIALPGLGAVGWPLGGRPSDKDLFYSYTSFLDPPAVHRWDPVSGRSTPYFAATLPFDAGRYDTRQVFFSSKDGTRVPMFVTAAKGLPLDGSHRLLLTGYGGYGTTMQPRFEPHVAVWLERGGVHALASLRGGGEYGAAWHEAGMLERKQNSFDDFIAAAEELVARRYTRPGRLAVHGHSNGGLLAAAVLVQRPDLFGAVVPSAGHHDMLRFHLFPAGAGWVSEYGSPDDPAALKWLRAYSPLHNVAEGACYPATLLLAADHDDRVVPSHSYKLAAALQRAQRCSRPVLLRVAAGAGHGYASAAEEIAEKADMLAFLEDALPEGPFAPAP